ncbi:MAG: hypothetical protein GY948_10170 [Alphaproteobacteria bacterium]|nr:hypothetical protein [Alphaproteobacteria bacterium]
MATSAPAKSVDSVRIQKRLQKVGIPRGMRDFVVTGAKRVMAPGEEERRVSYLSKVPKPRCVDFDSFKKAGAGFLDNAALPEGEAATQEAQALLAELKATGQVVKPARQRKRDFLVRLAGHAELLARPEIADFVLSDELLALASHYLGQVPVLTRFDMWWSPINDKMSESQFYHYDGEDETQLKIIVYLNDVDLENGPFTTLSAADSEKVKSTKVFAQRRSERLDDERVESIVGKDAVVRIVGPAGTLAACDTGRCLHYGSRAKSRDRFILMAQFTKFLCPKALVPDWKLEGDRRSFNPLQKLVLNVT